MNKLSLILKLTCFTTSQLMSMEAKHIIPPLPTTYIPVVLYEPHHIMNVISHITDYSDGELTAFASHLSDKQLSRPIPPQYRTLYKEIEERATRRHDKEAEKLLKYQLLAGIAAAKHPAKPRDEALYRRFVINDADLREYYEGADRAGIIPAGADCLLPESSALVHSFSPDELQSFLVNYTLRMQAANVRAFACLLSAAQLTGKSAQGHTFLEALDGKLRYAELHSEYIRASFEAMHRVVQTRLGISGAPKKLPTTYAHVAALSEAEIMLILEHIEDYSDAEIGQFADQITRCQIDGITRYRYGVSIAQKKKQHATPSSKYSILADAMVREPERSNVPRILFTNFAEKHRKHEYLSATGSLPQHIPYLLPTDPLTVQSLSLDTIQEFIIYHFCALNPDNVKQFTRQLSRAQVEGKSSQGHTLLEIIEARLEHPHVIDHDAITVMLQRMHDIVQEMLNTFSS